MTKRVFIPARAAGSVKVGDRRTVRPVTVGEYSGQWRKLQTGTVVFVHPKGRFCTLEFDTASGVKVQESFQMLDGEIAGLEADNRK